MPPYPPFLGTKNFEKVYNFSNAGLSYIILFVFPSWFQIWNSKWPNIYTGLVIWQKYSVIFYTFVLNICCHIDNVTKYCAVFSVIYDWCLIIEFIASVRQVAKTVTLSCFKIMSSIYYGRMAIKNKLSFDNDWLIPDNGTVHVTYGCLLWGKRC